MNSPVSYDIETDKNGNGFGVFLGRFSVETIASPPQWRQRPEFSLTPFLTPHWGSLWSYAHLSHRLMV